MKIVNVKVINFRVLNELEIELNDINSYLIGENNLGKSTFIEALNIVFSGKRFEEEDFGNPLNPIEVIVTLLLADGEKGFFGDNFSEEDDNKITIKYVQSYEESYPTAICLDTDETLSTKQLKKINFMKYVSTLNPNKELKIDSSNAAGKVFSGIVRKYLSCEDHDKKFLNEENIEDLSNYVNSMFSKIKGFSKYGIEAAVSDNVTDVITDLFFLSDGTRKIETTGSGIQYIAMVTLNIVSQIMQIYQQKGTDFGEQLYTNHEGKKILPLVVALDEPEVHLHPYLQRSLIDYYKKILQNRDDDFLELIKKCFEIEGLDGQLIVVTHSSDILVDDYKSIVRFYRDNGETKAVSGMEFKRHFDKGAEKQLLMHFHELREAFYSHCVIVVEGETEYGCMPYFAKKLGISLDNHCISIIMAQGESSIKPLKKLFECFKIPCICVYDGDVRSKRINDNGINFFTNELCFELEIIKQLYAKEEYEVIKNIAKDLNKQAETIVLDSDYVKEGFKYLGKPLEGYEPRRLVDIDWQEQDEFCTMYAVWFMKSKGVISGRIYGIALPEECIPQCYIDVFDKALEIVE